MKEIKDFADDFSKVYHQFLESGNEEAAHMAGVGMEMCRALDDLLFCLGEVASGDGTTDWMMRCSEHAAHIKELATEEAFA